MSTGYNYTATNSNNNNTQSYSGYAGRSGKSLLKTIHENNLILKLALISYHFSTEIYWLFYM